MKKTLKRDLRKYISNLKTKTKKRCNISKTCKKHSASKSGQQILICHKDVYKSPPIKKKQFNRIEEVKNRHNTFKLDSYNMNLLVQSVINLLPVSIRNKVEHYSSICKLNKRYSLKSKRLGYKINNIIYNSLEDYILQIGKIDVGLVCKWLEQVCKSLDKLYSYIQFHHCDTKCAQIFLSKKGNAVIGDLDKVTFSLIVDAVPCRIKLTRLPYKNRIINRFSKLPEKMNLLSKVEIMRFENLPRASPDLEKAGFICSAALLTGDINIANKIIQRTKKLYRGYTIVLPQNIANINDAHRHKASVRYVKETTHHQYANKLVSRVELLKNGKLKLL